MSAGPSKTSVDARDVVRILYVDDSAHDRALVRDALEHAAKSYQVTEAPTHAQLLAHLESSEFDIVLSDFNILGYEGLDVLEAVASHSPGTPVVIVTGTGSEEVAAEALKRGAKDYVVKSPRHIKQLPFTVEAVLERAQLQAAERRATEALAHAKEQLETIVENNRDGMLVVDGNGVVRFANTAATKIMQLERDTLIGTALGVPIETDAAVEIEVVRAEAAIGCAELRVAPLEWQGEPSFLVSLRDISERKRAATAIAKSERRFRALFENSLAPIAIADNDGRYLDVNAAFCELTGCERDQLLRMKVADLVTDTSDNAARQYELYKTAGGGQGEFTFVRPDGERRTALWAAAAIAENQHASVLQDISERKESERNLREARDRAQRYLDIAAVVLLGLDEQGRINLLNRRGCELLGFETEGHALGYDWFQLIPENERAQVRAIFRAILRGEIASHGQVEGHVETRVGEKKRMVWNNVVVTDPNGRIVGTLSSGEDVTERRQMQAQLAQADRLSSMGMLAAGVAHEINNPLAYILYNLESLTEDLPKLLEDMRAAQAALADLEPSSQLAETMAATMNPAMLDDILARFKQALGGTHRIRDIARGLGTFSRVEKNKLVPVHLMHVIEVALNMALNEIKYRARLVKEYGKTPAVMASEGRLSQVFLNLIINATHAIDEGNVEGNEIRVRTWSEGDTACAEVRDTGNGIPMENLDRLFEPFFTTKNVGVGSGLGLAISKNIVDGYGGTIEVQSEIGKGTRFVVRLPAQGEERVAAEAVSHAGSDEATERGRVLIVDDEDEIRTAMVRILRAHEIVQAASGAEAKALLETDQAFDLILCDVMMPDLSGMDLHQWLAATYPFLAKQLIFITGGAFTPRAREYLNEVDNIRLEKPFDRANLKKIVASMVRDAKAAPLNRI